VDLRLGGNIDPLRRLIEQQDIHAPPEPFGENDFLLIAAGQRRDFQVRPARADVEKVHQFGNQAPPGAAAAQTSTVAAKARQQDIVGNRLVHHQTEPARRRYKPNAGLDRGHGAV
jgi:hypothetical protein